MKSSFFDRRSARARRLSWLVVAGLTTAALVAPSSASATQPGKDGEHKVTICHRTNSVTNPYVVITVDYSGADGGLVHDNGNGDHTNHLGPVFDFDADPDVAYPPPHNGDQWGDIIPAFSWPGDEHHAGGSFPGLNWDDAGQVIWRDGCGRIVTTTTSSTTTTEATTTQQTTTEETTVQTTRTEETTTTEATTTTEETTTQTTTTEETTTTEQTTTTEPTPTPTPTPTPNPTPTPTPNPTPTPTPDPTPTPTPVPTPTPTPTPDPTSEIVSEPTGEVLSEVGAPRITLPPTDMLPAAPSVPAGDNWRLVFLAMAGILAASLLVSPRAEATRRTDR
jgi:hypothetical protein